MLKQKKNYKTKKRTGVKMKIAWLQDYPINKIQGGAAITNQVMMKEGRKRGHTFEEYNHESSHDMDNFKKIKKCDLVILNNINAFKQGFIKKIINNTRYVKYEHDYSFCEVRNAICEKCVHQGLCEPHPIFTEIYGLSLLNIFLSPLQLNFHKKFLGLTMRDAIIIPSPLRKGVFKPGDDNDRINEYLYAGALMPHKGVIDVLKFAEKEEVHFAGRLVNEFVKKAIQNKGHTYLGEVPFEKMPELYKKYKYFIINPVWPEPFGRTQAEAVASGCTIVNGGSRTTGFESYGLSKEKMLKKCYDAPRSFWKKVEGVI